MKLVLWDFLFINLLSFLATGVAVLSDHLSTVLCIPTVHDTVWRCSVIPDRNSYLLLRPSCLRYWSSMEKQAKVIFKTDEVFQHCLAEIVFVCPCRKRGLKQFIRIVAPFTLTLSYLIFCQHFTIAIVACRICAYWAVTVFVTNVHSTSCTKCLMLVNLLSTDNLIPVSAFY